MFRSPQTGIVLFSLYVASLINSYYSSSDAVIDGSTAELGQTAVTDDGTTVTITSCVEKGCAGDATMGNTITIE